MRNRFRELRDGQPEVGPGVAVPTLVKVDTAGSGDLHRRQEPRRFETGPVDDHVNRSVRAVNGGHASLGDLGDPVRDQFHVVPRQRPCPHAVVPQDPLGYRRVVGNDGREQLGRAELGLEVLREQLAHLIVWRAHGPLASVPLRIDHRGREQPLMSTPEEP